MRLCSEKMHISRISLAIRYVFTCLVKYRFSFSSGRSRTAPWLEAVALDIQGVIVDIGGEDLHLERRIPALHLLAQEDGDRIGLLAGCASRNPDADLVVGPFALQQLGDDPGLERVEGFAVAKELR